MIEEGFIYDDISNAIIRAYLSDTRFTDIHTMILGCTHYPIIKRQIEKFFNFNVDVIDAAHIVAQELKTKLEEMELCAPANRRGMSFIFRIILPSLRKLPKCSLKQLSILNIWIFGNRLSLQQLFMFETRLTTGLITGLYLCLKKWLNNHLTYLKIINFVMGICKHKRIRNLQEATVMHIIDYMHYFYISLLINML